jgi:hypothetical protein
LFVFIIAGGQQRTREIKKSLTAIDASIGPDKQNP